MLGWEITVYIDFVKICVREPKVANIDDTLVYLIPTLSK